LGAIGNNRHNDELLCENANRVSPGLFPDVFGQRTSPFSSAAAAFVFLFGLNGRYMSSNSFRSKAGKDSLLQLVGKFALPPDVAARLPASRGLVVGTPLLNVANLDLIQIPVASLR